MMESLFQQHYHFQLQKKEKSFFIIVVPSLATILGSILASNAHVHIHMAASHCIYCRCADKGEVHRVGKWGGSEVVWHGCQRSEVRMSKVVGDYQKAQ